MAGLDSRIRIFLESIVDNLLENPVEIEEGSRKRLLQMGVEPNLETSLAYFVGYSLGAAVSESTRLYGMPRDEDTEGAVKLLRRRAMELRDAFLKARID